MALLFIDLKHQICNCLDLGKILLLQRPSHQGHNKLTDAGNPWKVTGENSVASFPGHSHRQYLIASSMKYWQWEWPGNEAKNSVG